MKIEYDKDKEWHKFPLIEVIIDGEVKDIVDGWEEFEDYKEKWRKSLPFDSNNVNGDLDSDVFWSRCSGKATVISKRCVVPFLDSQGQPIGSRDTLLYYYTNDGEPLEYRIDLDPYTRRFSLTEGFKTIRDLDSYDDFEFVNKRLEIKENDNVHESLRFVERATESLVEIIQSYWENVRESEKEKNNK